MALTDYTHQLIRQHFAGKQKRCAVDATCGNGHDTEFLVQLGFEKVYGFDIQEAAIRATQTKVDDLATNIQVNLFLSSHEKISSLISEPLDCVMFNFGYLPNGDKNLTTSAASSIGALEAAANLLNNGGIITLMCYPGHPAGALETREILNLLEQLDDQWLVETHLASSPKPTAPILYSLQQI